MSVDKLYNFVENIKIGRKCDLCFCESNTGMQLQSNDRQMPHFEKRCTYKKNTMILARKKCVN